LWAWAGILFSHLGRFRPDHRQPLIWIRLWCGFSARTKPATRSHHRILESTILTHSAPSAGERKKKKKRSALPWAPSPAHTPADGWSRRRQATPRRSPTRARLHGAATVVVRVLAATTAPERAVVGGGIYLQRRAAASDRTSSHRGAGERRTDGVAFYPSGAWI
jgi:hypothetical protein